MHSMAATDFPRSAVVPLPQGSRKDGPQPSKCTSLITTLIPVHIQRRKGERWNFQDACVCTATTTLVLGNVGNVA